MASFTHRPLDEASGEIRLLSFIEPSGNDQPNDIECEIGHVPCTSGDDGWGDFAAISYVWGDAEDGQRITLNGHRFEVRKNLYDALAGLHRVDKTLRIWVDAICINQNDLEERNRQVGRMRDIFGKASTTYCFLPVAWNADVRTAAGPDSVRVEQFMQCDDAVEMVNQLFAKSQGHWKPLFISALKTGEITFRDEKWFALHQFFTNPFWIRLWIMQEIALAKRALVVCDTHILPWSTVAGAASLIRDGKYPIEVRMMQPAWNRNMHIWPYWYTICGIENLRQQRDSRDTYRYVDLVRRAKCSDPRDRVYGILSLVEPNWAAKVEVDYGKEAREVYREFVASGIEVTGSLRALPHYSRDEQTPSWVPDLGDERTLRPFRQACRADSNGLNFPVARVEGQKLIVSGLRLDIIDGISASSPSRFLARSYSRQAQQGIGMTQTTSPQTNTTNDDMAIDLVLTLVSGLADNDSTRTYLPPLEWLLSNQTAQGVPGALDFFQRNADFLLPNGTSLGDVLDFAPVDGVDYATAAGEIDYQLSFRRLATTEAGRLALVPPGAKGGDVVCVLGGLDTLGVLREIGEEGSWRWIGNAFMVGMMGVRHEGEMEEFVIV